ncbi:MAG: DUF3467 domain-containing protein [bacterium]
MDMDMDKQDKKKITKKTISIDISSELEKGTYANQVIIGHSQKEFILDFGLILPPGNKLKIVSRVITNPVDAKVLAMVLNENISRYEQMFGNIQVPRVKPVTPDHLH